MWIPGRVWYQIDFFSLILMTHLVSHGLKVEVCGALFLSSSLVLLWNTQHLQREHWKVSKGKGIDGILGSQSPPYYLSKNWRVRSCLGTASKAVE